MGLSEYQAKKNIFRAFIESTIESNDTFYSFIASLRRSKVKINPIIINTEKGHRIKEVQFTGEGPVLCVIPWEIIKEKNNYSIADFPILDILYKELHGVSITEKYASKEYKTKQTLIPVIEEEKIEPTEKNKYKKRWQDSYESLEHLWYGLKKGKSTSAFSRGARFKKDGT